MGVTLERVQFKFASIIGELCSEPDILSQFAVWVDLRLAEYKLKGSISLDCSGDTPDPVWLQGILSVLLAKKIAKQRAVPKPSGHSYGRSLDNFTRIRSPSYKSQRPTATLNADDAPVNVKVEPYDEGVYPVGPPSQNIADRHRKRSATVDENDTDQSDILFSHSTPKQRRSENNGNPSTESLMSIIGEGGQAENNSTLQFDSMNDTPDVMMNNENPENTSQEAGNISEIQYGDQSSTSYDRGHTSSNLGNLVTSGDEVVLIGDEGSVKKVFFHSSRSRHPTERQVDTSRKTAGHVKQFQMWLRKSEYQDFSEMKDIPPELLDTYLASFFSTIRRQDGEDYSHNTFRSLRDSLERHLREVNYPASLTLSVSFPKSQLAYKKRVLSLKYSEVNRISTDLIS